MPFTNGPFKKPFTIEEKIRDLQQKKADLLDTALGGEGDILKMSANEVLSLLE